MSVVVGEDGKRQEWTSWISRRLGQEKYVCAYKSAAVSHRSAHCECDNSTVAYRYRHVSKATHLVKECELLLPTFPGGVDGVPDYL